MSLSATMWTSVSGLLNHGKKMNTIGNNIANISTVGFKGQRMDFADFVYQDTHSLAGATQNGFGVQVGAIMGNFSQGAFETTQESTDLAISGSGFFQVQPVGSEEAYYTRAGNFRFDADGYLLDPNGYALQGWKVENEGGVQQAIGANPLLGATTGSTSPIIGTGVPTDIQLDTFTVFPQQTTNMTFNVNLPQDGADNAKNTTNPFAGLFDMWNGTQPPPTANTPAISQSSYAEQTTITIYDEAGVKHTATVYFDRINPSDYEGGSSGDEMWEYIVTIDPAEDNRQFWNGSELQNVNTTEAGGLLMSGTLTFDSGGALQNQTAYTWGGGLTPENSPTSFEQIDDPAGGLEDLSVINLNPTDMNNWTPAPISNDGYPIVVANFSGVLDAQTSGTSAGAKYNMEVNFGVKASNLASPWQNTDSLGSMAVSEPYAVNPNYDFSDPTKGPEFLSLNPAASPTISKFDTSFAQYIVNGTGTLPNAGTLAENIMNKVIADLAAGSPAVNIDEPTYAQAIQFYGVDTVTLSAKSVDGTFPTEKININLLTGEITNADGAVDADTYNFGLGAGPVDVPTPTLGATEDVKIDLATGEVTNAAGLTDPTGNNFGLGKLPLDIPSGVLGATQAITIAANGTVTNADGHEDPDGQNYGLGNLTAITGSTAAMSAISKAVQTTVSASNPEDLSLVQGATPANANNLAEFTEPAVIESTATTNLGGSFSSTNSQNGYGFGNLTSWNFDADGVLYGVYSNGVNLPLWQVTMYDFNNTQGLRREGNNLFSETRDSGSPKSGAAGTAGLGNVAGYSLEQSNVDMATEFVYMISTQRGYQANSKSITTTDTMLETVINMKR